MYYVLDENNNKVEALDKEGVLTLLETAIENGDLESVAVDSAFVDKLKCHVTGATNYVAFVTQARYNELSSSGGLSDNTLYFITDDNTCEDIDNDIETIENDIVALQNICSNIPSRTLQTITIDPPTNSSDLSLYFGLAINLGANKTFIFNLDGGTIMLYVPSVQEPTDVISTMLKCTGSGNYAYELNYHIYTNNSELNRLTLLKINLSTGENTYETASKTLAYFEI